MAFRLSMLTSQIAGPSIWSLLMHRLFYFGVGVALLFVTAFFLDRLANHKALKISNGLIGVALLGLSSILMFKLWTFRHETITSRQEKIQVNGLWADQPNVDILSNHINLELIEGELVGIADIEVQNKTDQQLSQVYFTLNPSLSG